MHRLDGDAVAAFVAVVDFGSFKAAAKELGKTQAAISIAVARLEDRIGHKLLNRGHRTLSLTARGERFLLYARKIQALEAEAMADMFGRSTDSRVRLGMPDDYLTYFGVALIERFSPTYRNIYIDLQCRFSRTLEAMVDNRELDLAIVTQHDLHPRGEILRHERQFWCTAADAEPEALDCLHLALFSEECPSMPSLLSTLGQAGRRWRVVYSSSHLAGVQLAVASGKLLTVLPEPAIPANWRRLGPADGLPDLPPLPLALLMGPSDRLPTRQVAAFLKREFARPSLNVARLASGD